MEWLWSIVAAECTGMEIEKLVRADQDPKSSGLVQISWYCILHKRNIELHGLSFGGASKGPSVLLVCWEFHSSVVLGCLGRASQTVCCGQMCELLGLALVVPLTRGCPRRLESVVSSLQETSFGRWMWAMQPINNWASGKIWLALIMYLQPGAAPVDNHAVGLRPPYSSGRNLFLAFQFSLGFALPQHIPFCFPWVPDLGFVLVQGI
jgi:hypothetical protein